MKIKTGVTLYICEHCQRKFLIASAAEKHERQCKKNPDNERACYGCSHLIKKEATVWSGVGDMNGEELDRKVDLLYCSAHSIFLYTPQIEAKGNAFEPFEADNEPMPRECQDYKDYFSESDF